VEVVVAADTNQPTDGARLRVTMVRSTIGHNAAARGTIRALGLHRLNETIEIADTPTNRGMLRRVAFLLEVEEAAAAGQSTNEGTDSHR
jgi:large subunit ribosomal protein L30